MRSPDEIKKGLACCAEASQGACEHCPYMIDCETFDNAGNLYRDALAYINQLEARVPKWISVKDRVPEPSTYVLALTAPGALSVGENVIVADYIHPKKEEYGVFIMAYTPYADQYILPVTHWMPLPEPPKEE